MEKTFEQRRYPRRPFGYAFGILDKGVYSIVETYEIGERGAGFISDLNLKNGDIIVVSFFIQAQFITCQAQVRYSVGSPKRYGVEFTNIKFEDRRNIRDYIADKGDAETLFAHMIAGQIK